MSRHALLFASLLALVAHGAAAGPGTWSSVGPESGTVNELAVDPATQTRLFAIGGFNTVYRSTDAGVAWTALSVAPHLNSVYALRLSPHDSDTLVVTGGGNRVYRSLDGGDSWLPLAGGLPVPVELYDVAFDPHLAGRLWATTAEGLYRSDDGGDTWALQATAGLGLQRLARLVPDPHVANRLLAVSFDPAGTMAPVVRVSSNGGSTWVASSGLDGVLLINQGANNQPFAFTSVAGDVLMIAFGGVHRSADGGASFAAVGPITLANPRSPLLIRAHPVSTSTWIVGTETGLARTTDNGLTYTAIGGGIRPAAGGYSNGVGALHIRSDAPDTYYAGALYTGFYASTDAGASWLRRNNGLRQASIRALAVHPTQPLWLFAGYGDAFNTPSDGLFQSIDRGASWFSTTSTLEASGLRAFAIDGNTAANPFTTTLYAAGYGSPLYALGGTIRDGNAGIYKSTNGGATWTTIETGIPKTTVGTPQISHFSTARSVVLDPSSGGAPGGTGPLQTLYLGGSGRINYNPTTGAPTVLAARIYKSTNAGASWTASDTGLPVPIYDTVNFYASAVQVVPLVVDPATPTTLYAGTFTTFPETPGGFQEPLVSQGVLNGVFKSTDAGANWVHSSNGLPRGIDGNPDSAIQSVLALALAPSNPSVLYAAVNRILGDSRIYKSVDAGANWTLASAGIAPDADIRALLVDPTDADIAYAGSTGSDSNPGGVYRTLDGGVSWTSYSIGLPSSAVLALELDRSGVVPRLYAGTRNGVFSIDQVPDEDLDGAPSAIEAGAPNGGDGNGDGIPDTVQPRVASLPGAGDPGRGGDAYLSLALTPVSGACTRMENTHALPAASFPPDPGFGYDHGLVRLDLTGCTQAQLAITVHGASFGPAWRFRIYAPLTPAQVHTYAWRDFPATRSGNTWTVTLTDNALGDLRDSTGAILFQGGMAFSETIFAHGFE